MPDKEIRLLQKEGQRNWSVYSGELYDTELISDEALCVVASILLGVKPKYLRTAEEWREYEKVHGLNEGER